MTSVFRVARWEHLSFNTLSSRVPCVADWMFSVGWVGVKRLRVQVRWFFVSVPALFIHVNHIRALWPYHTCGFQVSSPQWAVVLQVSPPDRLSTSINPRGVSGQLVYVGEETLGPPLIQVNGYEVWKRKQQSHLYLYGRATLMVYEAAMYILHKRNKYMDKPNLFLTSGNITLTN